MNREWQNDMTITQLKYVITVAESNSMNEAAGKLFISQPSLLASIKELENEIGKLSCFAEQIEVLP